MITNGTVKFLRRVNLGNYEHKEASVELTVANPDGPVSEQQLEITSRLAVAKAYEMLAEFKDTSAPFVPTTAATAPALVAPSAPSVEVHAPLVGAVHSPAAIATTLPAASTPPALVGNGLIGTGEAVPPTQAAVALVSPAPTPISPAPALIGAGETTDPTLIDATAAPGSASPALISTAAASAPAEIADADLVNAITAANARMFARATTEEEKQLVPRNLTAALLAHLPATFAGPPKVQMIPVEKRPAALAAFNAL